MSSPLAEAELRLADACRGVADFILARYDTVDVTRDQEEAYRTVLLGLLQVLREKTDTLEQVLQSPGN
jgi:hypothetical protein